MRRYSIGMLSLAVALTLVWVGPLVGGAAGSLSTGSTVLVSGLSVLGASFLLAWAAETAEKDVPRAFAIAVLAVLAVAPEYAVDALYAFDAGQYAGTARGVEAGNLAVANMTGANRILIGLGWSGITLFTIFRTRSNRDPAVETRAGFLTDAVGLDHDIGLEIVFLFLATAWAFLVPLNGGIDVFDTVVLVGLYVAYIVIVLRGDVDTGEEHVGVPAYLQSFARSARVTIVVALFLYAGIVILTAVEPFAYGLEQLGTDVGIPSFFMIQWIAPLASESPELIVVAVLVTKARSTAGFNTLISSKLNQWTLLIGTLVVVYSIGLGQYGTLSFDPKQAAEIWLTAAQSLFALSILVNFEISVREALLIFSLFVSQVVVEFLIIRRTIDVGLSSYETLLAFTALYVVLSVYLLVSRRHFVRAIAADTAETARAAIAGAERSTPAD